ncbi:MAG: dihydrofolate reductase family protein [Trichodesmium sp.]
MKLYLTRVRNAIQSFLQEDLIDEMIITRAPIILGKGFPLFGYKNIFSLGTKKRRYTIILWSKATIYEIDKVITQQIFCLITKRNINKCLIVNST